MFKARHTLTLPFLFAICLTAHSQNDSVSLLKKWKSNFITVPLKNLPTIQGFPNIQKDSAAIKAKDSTTHKYSLFNRVIQSALPNNPFSRIFPGKVPGDSSKPDVRKYLPLPQLSFKDTAKSKAPLLSIGQGYISYNFNFRNRIDTPFAEKNISQHTINSSMRVAIKGFPVLVNTLIRQSNSGLFRDIADVQVAFDGAAYKNTLKEALQKQLLQQTTFLKDSFLIKSYQAILNDWTRKFQALNNPVHLQKLQEYKEILNVPDITLDKNLSDSANLVLSDRLKKEASSFIELYEQQQQQQKTLTAAKDSIAYLYQKMISRINEFENLVKNGLNGFIDTRQLTELIKKYGLKNAPGLMKYAKWMGLRKLSLGRSPVNYSELTSKNISLTGINVEYSSWYYAAASAGTVDYRFRDFMVGRFNRTPQYMYLFRLGIGQPESNHVFFTYYGGQKQLFASSVSGNGLRSIRLSGMAAEIKMKLARSTYVVGEAAASVSPDFSKNPAEVKKFTIQDKTNKAYSLQFYSYLPKTSSKIEALYKYTGAGFQSFSNFQSNAQQTSWSIKADQSFFKRKLRITAGVRANDFTNPYIAQRYEANTLFKTAQVSFRARKLPTITIGYQPYSQLTYVDSVLTENRFQSLQANLTHAYKIGLRTGSSSFVYNRFYNEAADSSFAYYNAENIFWNQTINFSDFDATLSVSRSRSTGFELNVLDAFLNFKAGKLGTAGLGVRVNNFNKQKTGTGIYGSVQLNLGSLGMLSVMYDDGYLPSANRQFIKNSIMNINFTKQIR